MIPYLLEPASAPAIIWESVLKVVADAGPFARPAAAKPGPTQEHDSW